MPFNPYKTVENQTVVELTDGGDNKPAKELLVEIAAVQSGTGDPSPENPREIVGCGGVVAVVAGRNFFDEDVEDGSISNTGQNTASTTTLRSKGISPVIPGKTYYIKQPADMSLRVCEYAKDGTFLYRSDGRTSSGTFEARANCYGIRLMFTKSVYDKNVSFNYPATDTDYHAHVGAVYSKTFAAAPDGRGTVYGGTLDLVTGVLTVTHANIASYAGEEINKPWISSIDVYDPDGSPSEGAQVVYPLTEPEEYRVVPADVRTVLGDNTIWADSGKILKLTYIYHFIQLETEEDEMKSGYVMIDCGGLDLTGGSTPQTLSGLYARIKEAMGTGKLTLAENCINGSGVAISPLPVAAYNVSSTKAGLLFGTLLIEVTNEDSATVTDLTSAG